MSGMLLPPTQPPLRMPLSLRACWQRMSRWKYVIWGRAAITVLALVMGSTYAAAQPIRDPEPTLKSVSVYIYLINAKGDKVLVNTQLWRNDFNYDERALRRFYDVLSALEKRGFHKDDKAVIDNWEDPKPFTRCYIYMEDLQAARRTKSAMQSGARLTCTENGASEYSVSASDSPKHVDDILKHFDIYLARAQKKVHK